MGEKSYYWSWRPPKCILQALSGQDLAKNRHFWKHEQSDKHCKKHKAVCISKPISFERKEKLST